MDLDHWRARIDEVDVRLLQLINERLEYAVEIGKIKQAEGRQIRDNGELQTACQAACPSNSIVFGDVNNPETRISQIVAGIRSYRILVEVGAKPSVFYLTRIWNA